MSSAPLTIRDLRKRGHWLWIACGRCNAGRMVEVAAVPDRFDQATVRDLQYGGRFRCTGCGTPASATMVYNGNSMAAIQQLERWTRPGEQSPD